MNNTEDTKPDLIEQQFASPVYDQFAGICHDLSTNSRLMRILRMLRKNGSFTEGELACRVGERIYCPDWASNIAKLVELGYISSKPSGKGLHKTISLEEKGEQFLHDRLDPRPKLTEEKHTRTGS